jgi:4'-phosphopantetheinyl transferase
MEATVNWALPPQTLILPKNEIHIWRAWLDVDIEERARLSSHLSEGETIRANRFVFPRDQDHFVVGRGILRELLGKYLHRPAGSLKFKTGPQGKPCSSGTDQGDVQFNLSHSHGLALYAFGRQGELGIDVEKIRPEFAGVEIAERYFSKAEQQELLELPSNLRTLAFFLCWTRKEAYVKAHGGGLQIPLDSFDVSLSPEKPDMLRSADNQRWTLRSFAPEAMYAAALVAEGAIESIKWFSVRGKPR